MEFINDNKFPFDHIGKIPPMRCRNPIKIKGRLQESDRPLIFIENYSHFLDSHIFTKDRYYFIDNEILFKLVEAGYRTNGYVPDKQKLIKRMKDAKKLIERKNKSVMIEHMIPKQLATCPLVEALAVREKMVRNQQILTIIHVQTPVRQKSGQIIVIGGFIDYFTLLVEKLSHLLPVFSGEKPVVPTKADLGYYTKSQSFVINHNDRFEWLISTGKVGVISKIDQLIIDLRPRSETNPGKSTVATTLTSTFYRKCSIYDHFLRKPLTNTLSVK